MGFLFVILVGSILLSLPISSATGAPVAYIDALFAATAATCVTGLTTVTTASAWSAFGQLVILALIQIGGLGVITVLSAFMIIMGKKMRLGDRLLIMDSFSLNSLSGLVDFIKKVVTGSFIIEAVGAVLCMCVFVPEFGAKGVWISVFHSISAFCNAGMDIIGDSGLCSYVNNPVINIVTSALTILGGIGFVVWWDVLRIMRNKNTRHLKYLSLHSKIVLTTTLCLILFGAAAIFAFEYENPETIGNLSLMGKIQASLFQSITTRSAGFATIPQKSLTLPASITSILLMFIGGSPVSAAGGIKTVTFVVLIATFLSVIKDKKEVVLFNRRLSDHTIKKVVAITVASSATLFASVMFLSFLPGVNLIDILYEAAGAATTVGLSRNLTPSLNLFGKIIIIFTMYFGRVSPISFVIAFRGKSKRDIVTDPVEDIIL